MNHGIGISGQASLTYYKIVFRDRVPLREMFKDNSVETYSERGPKVV